MSTDTLKNCEAKVFERKKQTEADVKLENSNRGKKPIVISSQRFDKIVKNATTTDRSKALADAAEEKKSKEQLKAESDKLVAKFKGNMPRTQEQKLQQIKGQMDKKIKQGIAAYEQAKENEAQKRQEKIAKAEQIMERLKPGPRALHSAVLQSEVLRARNVQRSINEEFAKAIKKQEYEATKQCNEQASNWIEEEQQRLNERRMNTNIYKKELLQTINENQRHRHEQKKQTIKEQQAARQVTDTEVKAQIEKEKAIMEKKREALRKNALEAMKMVEQRRLRDHMVDGLEDRLCCVYNAGKSKLDALRNEQSKRLADEQQQKIENEVSNLNNMDNNFKALESERIRRDISTMQLKFTAEEQEKVRKDKAAKQARIEAYIKEMQHQKEVQYQIEDNKRNEMAQRLKNAEINYMFAENEKQQKLRQFQNVRSQLNQQIDDNKRYQLAQKQAVHGCSDSTVDEAHNYFFNHARNLMEDAQQKGRPLHPFVWVVNQYKRDNQIDCERKIPKHLQSNVPIGEKSSVNLEKRENETQNSARENILQNCYKINEIIRNANSKQDERFQLESTASGLDDMPKLVKVRDGCASSPQLRYSIDELKKMNQYTAPTCH